MKSNYHIMKRINISGSLKAVFLSLFFCIAIVHGFAQSRSNRIMVGAGAQFPRGLEATLAWEHETKNHNAWEYFANTYLKYEDDPEVGHITRQSFWNSYNTWGVGVAYKPCVLRGGVRHGRNQYGTLRLGGSLGSDTEDVVGWVNLGYEHNYALRHGWHLYWQVKGDICINGKDFVKAGVAIGVKIPYSAR